MVQLTLLTLGTDSSTGLSPNWPEQDYISVYDVFVKYYFAVMAQLKYSEGSQTVRLKGVSL